MRVYTVCHSEDPPTVRIHSTIDGLRWLEFKDDTGATPVSVVMSRQEVETLIKILQNSLDEDP